MQLASSPRKRKAVAAMPFDTTSLKCNDSFLQWSSLQTIKSKRVKELAYLKKRIYELERDLVRAQRCHSTVLPWEEVAKALADDTLDKVRENRTLKSTVEYNRHKYAFLREWVHGMTPPKRHVISTFHESWRHSHIFDGDASMRKAGYEWLTTHVYHNTSREMARAAPFPETDDAFVHADVTCNDNVMHVAVTSQLIVPYPLEATATALWVADRTLLGFVSEGTVEERAPIADNIVYHREEMGPASGHIRVAGNMLYGKFTASPNRVVLVKRSVLKDDAHPLDSDVWTCDVKQWFANSIAVIVADRVDDSTTRCRMYDVTGHPCTERGYVPIRELAKCFRLQARDDAEAAALLRLRTIDSQQHERVRFAELVHMLLEQQTLTDAMAALDDASF